MAGKPDGTVAAERSRTAILAALAAAAALKKPGERQAFIKKHKLHVGERDVYRALKLRMRPAGPGALTDPDQREWVWNAMEADAAKLGLDLIVAWLPPPPPTERRDQAGLLTALRSTPGVLGIDDCYDDTIVVRALATDPPAKRRLQSRLRELCPQALWTEVRQVDHDQPGRGWLGLAKAVAKAEGRLKATPSKESTTA